VVVRVAAADTAAAVITADNNSRDSDGIYARSR
jgi:hypothetical protein